MKRILAVLALLTVILAGCGKQKGDNAEPQTSTEPPADSQMQVDPQPPKEQEPVADEQAKLTAEQASAYVEESIDSTKYSASLTEEKLTVGTDQPQDYFVFEVKDQAGSEIGKVAVNQETGEKYNYLGDGVLDDYKTFALYDAAVDEVSNWDGEYTGVASSSLSILQGDASSFEFTFSDGTTGNARVSGNTAKSTDEKISFLFSDGIITVAGGTVTGNYTAVVAQ